MVLRMCLMARDAACSLAFSCKLVFVVPSRSSFMVGAISSYACNGRRAFGTCASNEVELATGCDDIDEDIAMCSLLSVRITLCRAPPKPCKRKIPVDFKILKDIIHDNSRMYVHHAKQCKGGPLHSLVVSHDGCDVFAVKIKRSASFSSMY